MSDAALVQLALAAGLTATTLGLATLAKVDVRGPIARAVARATVQLLLVGAALAVVTRHGGLIAVAFTVMLTTATFTSATRIGIAGLKPMLAVAIGAPAGAVAAALLASGAVPASPLSAVATTGILVGGAMTGASLTGRALVRELERDRAVIETRLLLGSTLSSACREAVQHSMVSGLVPALDQTRTVGLITLPGTFVGLVLGGTTPQTAARIQLLVLIGILAVQLVAALAVSRAVLWKLGDADAERLRTTPPEAPGPWWGLR